MLLNVEREDMKEIKVEDVCNVCMMVVRIARQWQQESKATTKTRTSPPPQVVKRAKELDGSSQLVY